LSAKPTSFTTGTAALRAVAKIVSVTSENPLFFGSFCCSCGFIDFLEDFVHEFKTLTNEAELKICKLTRKLSKQITESSIDEKQLSTMSGQALNCISASPCRAPQTRDFKEFHEGLPKL
jgi:hypothetical protein